MLFDYANAATEALESREGDLYFGRIGYYYLFSQRRGMANLRYDFVDENTDGLHWENQGHRVALSTVLPLSQSVSADLYGEAFFQEYDNVNTIFGEKRSDAIKTLSAGITWQMLDNTALYARYQYTRADSNIFLYEYRRHLAMAGVEFAF